MSRFIVLIVVLSVAAAAEAQTRSRSTLVRNLKRNCEAATDSGTANQAVGQLGTMLAASPNDAELAALQENCQRVAREHRLREDQMFDQAVAEYQRGAMEEARTKFQSLAGRETAHKKVAQDYLARITARSAAPPPASGTATPRDYEALESARRNYNAQKYAEARRVLMPLLDKPGVGPEAKKLLDSIDAYERHADLLVKGNAALRQRRCQDAYVFFQQIKQEDPAFLGLSKSLNDWSKQCGAPLEAPAKPAEPAVEEDDSAEKARQQVRNGELAMQKRDYAKAQYHFNQALRHAPDDETITRQLERARSELRRSGQTAEAQQAAEMAAMLEDGVRGFYAGKYTDAGRLFEQCAGSNMKHRAAAAFFAGAAAFSEFILGGQQNKELEARARQWFERARQFDARFEPPAGAVSPKIVAVFRATTGSTK